MRSTQPTVNSIIQVAGVRDRGEAGMLGAAGVDWIGFPLRLALHAPDTSEAEAVAIIRALKPSVTSVLITYLDTATAIAQFCRELAVRHVQLHGEIAVAELQRLRELDGGLFVIKSLVVRERNESELAAAVWRFSPQVDAFITDTYDAATGACGATGKTHDWRVSRRLVELSPRPVILAGGLTPDNVAAAIRAVRPAGVDVHTGVEDRDGRKDPQLVQRFVAAARDAFAAG
ncbi:MAG: N-(5'-phosphoribosyl)anthranilate isomerase [Lentisphaerae bacterium RIFOXYB12_FULL_65_16]|nr:MAG: N-(5'-phosphoribosyl)anthranilate isomerase [Lentisphaerae bacterium RIFOXYA12_64_32]OGV89912.1 MAG: N-(5'-phosphoribosyl)anthranilate isomerase [Lentisphaerae bacterium RIFOXYB12_FULL_65_16]